MDDEPTTFSGASLSMKLYVDEFHESRTLVSPDCFGTAHRAGTARLEKQSDARRAPIKSQRSRSFVRFRGDVAPRGASSDHDARAR